MPNTYFFSGEVAGEAKVPILSERSVALMGEQDKEAQRLLMAFSRITDSKNRMKVVAIVEAVAAAFAEASGSSSCVESDAL